MKPGVYKNISNEDYHRGSGLSSSDLKLLERSPMHYRAAKETEPRETDAMRLGTAVHCAVLEPERFDAEYLSAPEGLDRRTKAGKEAWAELDGLGKTVLSKEEKQNVLGMAQAVKKNSIAAKLLSSGIAEQSCYWEQTVYYGDEVAEVLCKCRPDYIKEVGDGYVVVDLKTTQDAREKAFQRRAYWDLGYHISAAHYVTGLTAILGRAPKAFIFVAVESTPPYGVNVFKASNAFLTVGQETNESLYKVFAACSASGDWRGYPEVIQELVLPRGA